MVALATAQIPATINTVEALNVWSSVVLRALHPNLTAVESSGNAQLVVTSAPYWIATADPAVWRHISRTSIVLDPAWTQGTNKLWTYAQPLSTAAIPSGYTS